MAGIIAGLGTAAAGEGLERAYEPPGGRSLAIVVDEVFLRQPEAFPVQGLQPNRSATSQPVTLGFVYWVSTQVNGGLSQRTAVFDDVTITIRH